MLKEKWKAKYACESYSQIKIGLAKICSLHLCIITFNQNSRSWGSVTADFGTCLVEILYFVRIEETTQWYYGLQIIRLVWIIGTIQISLSCKQRWGFSLFLSDRHPFSMILIFISLEKHMLFIMSLLQIPCTLLLISIRNMYVILQIRKISVNVATMLNSISQNMRKTIAYHCANWSKCVLSFSQSPWKTSRLQIYHIISISKYKVDRSFTSSHCAYF